MTFPLKTTFSLTAALALAACGGGGGGGTGNVVPVGNLTASGLRVISSSPNAAHEIEMETAIVATTDYQNVQIEYHALYKQDVDNGSEDPRQHELGTFGYESVAAGTSAQRATIRIPADVDPAGEYYIIARVDPLDEIRETNEDDNLPGENAPDVVIEIARDRLQWNDIVLESLEPDTDVIVISEDQVLYQVGTFADVANSHFGVTVEMTTSGQNPVQRVDLTARVQLPDGTFHDLSIWDEVGEAYDTRYWVDEIHPDIPTTVHMDLTVGPSLRGSLNSLLALQGIDQVMLQVRSNVFGNINEWEVGSQRWDGRDDNVIEVPIRIVTELPDADPGSLEFEADFEKIWANKVFGVGLDIAGYSYLDDRGAIGSLKAAIPVILFRSRADIMALDAYAQSTPQDESQSRFSFEVKSLGQTLFSAAQTSPSYTYDNTWSVRKSREVKAVVWVGPVPIEVSAGCSGTIGYDTSLTLTPSSIEFETGPFGEIDAFAQAQINLVVASGGIRGDMTLLREELTARTSAQLSIVNGGTRLQGPLTQELTHTLTGPNGRLYLFVNYPGVKLCKTILGSIPCGVRTHRKEKTLVRFATFQKVDTLFANTQFGSVDL